MVMSTELSAYEDHCVVADGRALSGETRVLGVIRKQPISLIIFLFPSRVRSPGGNRA
jgi:hypothetical protein